MKRAVEGVAILAALALTISACTGEGDSVAGPRATAQPPDSEPTATEGLLPEEDPSGPFDENDDVLTIAVRDPSTLDPMRIQDPGSVLAARQIYEGLTRWDPVERQVAPAAAERWSVSRDARTFTFQLRQGMTFHDGSPVRARDFAFAFNRIARKANASDLAYTLERVQGFESVNRFAQSNHLSGIRAVGDLTLVVRLSEPFAELPALFTHPGLVPLPSRAVRDIDSFLAEPVGNGPFRVARPWSPGSPLVLEAFPGFIETPDLDGIRMLPYPDAAASWLPFLNENIDVAEVPSDQFEAAEEAFGDRGYQDLLSGYYYGLNVDSAPLRDERLRRALNLAVDRAAIASSIFNETMRIPRGIVPPGMAGFERGDPCGGLCEFDPPAARALVRRLPRRSRTVTLEYTKGPPDGRVHAQVARALRNDFRAVGLRVKLRAFRFTKLLKRLRDGDQAAYRLGWIAEYPSATEFLGALFASDSPDNHSGFESGRVDALLNKAQRELSENKRARLYRRAEEAVLEQVPILPIGTFVMHWAAQPYVRDIYFDATGGFDATSVSLE